MKGGGDLDCWGTKDPPERLSISFVEPPRAIDFYIIIVVVVVVVVVADFCPAFSDRKLPKRLNQPAKGLDWVFERSFL